MNVIQVSIEDMTGKHIFCTVQFDDGATREKMSSMLRELADDLEAGLQPCS